MTKYKFYCIMSVVNSFKRSVHSTEKYSRGRRGAPAKGVGRIYPAREFKSLLLRQKQKRRTLCSSFLFLARRALNTSAAGARGRKIDRRQWRIKGDFSSGSLPVKQTARERGWLNGWRQRCNGTRGVPRESLHSLANIFATQKGTHRVPFLFSYQKLRLYPLALPIVPHSSISPRAHSTLTAE